MIIAIETATEVCSAALVHGGATVSVRSVREKNIHSERLMLLVDEVLNEARVSRNALDAVAVSIGPGSFTGLRIGLSAAKGLALALDIPLIAVPTLDGIAESYRTSPNGSTSVTFCAMIDAKREEAFYAFYAIRAKEIERTSDFAITVKSGILADASKRGSIIDQPEISASAIGHLAERLSEKFTLTDFTAAEPLYLRDFVATLPKTKVSSVVPPVSL